MTTTTHGRNGSVPGSTSGRTHGLQPTLGELERDWRSWRARRERDLATDHGWLSITWFSWLGHEPAAVAELPGRWSTHDGSAVLSAVAADGLVLLTSGGNGPRHHDGAVPDSEAVVDGEVRADVPEAGSLRWVRHGRRIVELVRRGGRLALRLRDPAADTLREFTGVPTFPHTTAWVLDGTFVAFPEPRRVEVATAREDLRQEVTTVGTLTLVAGPAAYPLVVGPGDDGALTLSFHDATNGLETAPWRVVTTSVPDADGRVTVDFNRAVNLPFAFTDHGTCPAPVVGNRLPIAVTAGEKAPRRVTR